MSKSVTKYSTTHAPRPPRDLPVHGPYAVLGEEDIHNSSVCHKRFCYILLHVFQFELLELYSIRGSRFQEKAFVGFDYETPDLLEPPRPQSASDHLKGRIKDILV
eukprot:4859188-Amphidinium_carterae.1